MSSDFESLGSVGRAALGVLLLVIAAYGLGSLSVGYLFNRRPVARLLLRLAVGLNLVAWLGIVAGMLDWLAGGRSAALLIGCSAVGAVAMWRSRGLWPPSSRRITRPKPVWFASLATIAGLVTLGPALCYPTGWDELVYHHELPRRWLADGWPAFYPDLPYSGFPSLGEILCWLAAPVEGVITPRLIVWTCWAIGIAITYLLLRRRLAQSSATALTAAFALSGAVLMISANCYVESILLMNAAALFLALDGRLLDPWKSIASVRSVSRCLQRTSPHSHALVLGILAGGAAAIKLTGLAIALLPILWYVLQFSVGRCKTRQTISALAIFSLAAASIAFPFYLRPWLATGNPFYPYYADWFSADAARIEMSHYHHALGAAFGIRNTLGFLAGPLLLAYDFELYDGTFGWQLLGLILLAAVKLKRWPRLRERRFIAFPALATVWLYVFWFLTAQQARFAVPAALCLTLVAGSGLRAFHGRQRRLAIAILVVATIVSIPWRNTGHYFGSWLTALGAIRSRDYVNESTDKVYLPLVEALEKHTPPDAKVMVLFEHRLFYLPRKAIIGTPFFQEAGFTPPENYEQPASLMERLVNDQVTHVVVTNAPAGPDQVPGWFDRLERFLPCFGQCVKDGRLKIVWQSERYILLEVLH